MPTPDNPDEFRAGFLLGFEVGDAAVPGTIPVSVDILGPIGDQGPMGPQGITGPAGFDGPIGYTGFTGVAGLRGPTGDKGTIGPTGVDGDIGPQGPIGDPGPTGNKGDTGIQGLQGPAMRVLDELQYYANGFVAIYTDATVESSPFITVGINIGNMP